MESNFDHLKVKMPLHWWVRFYLWRTTGWFLNKPIGMRLVGPTAEKLSPKWVYHELITIKNKWEGDKNLILRSSAGYNVDQKATQFDSGYGYVDEKQDLDVVYQYEREFREKTTTTETLDMHAETVRVISDLIDKNEITEVHNFGVCYAMPDYTLAKKYPHIKFFGIERSKSVIEYNQKNFNLPNIEYIASDIYQYLNSLDPKKSKGKLFYHARTMALLPQAAIEAIYDSVAPKFEFIFGIEQTGISREKLKAYDYSTAPQKSWIYRTIMFLHNYPGILSQRGYETANSLLLKTSHRAEDYRFLSFVGKKK